MSVIDWQALSTALDDGTVKYHVVYYSPSKGIILQINEFDQDGYPSNGLQMAVRLDNPIPKA